MRHFLLVYDIEKGALKQEPREYRARDTVQALNDYARLEAEYRGGNVQVVLVASDSIATVRITHANFFGADSFDALLQDAMNRQVAEVG